MTPDLDRLVGGSSEPIVANLWAKSATSKKPWAVRLKTIANVAVGCAQWIKQFTEVRRTKDAEIDARFAAIEAQLAARKELLADVFKGQWRAGDEHKRGSICQHQGSPWLCMRDTSQRPGASSDWQLFSKRGRDGRDGRDLR